MFTFTTKIFKPKNAEMLGLTFKDKITGFTGIATGHVEYISGCNQTLLVPKIDESGSFREGHWFDDQRLEQLKEDKVALDNSSTPGSDKAAPKG